MHLGPALTGDEQPEPAPPGVVRPRPLPDVEAGPASRAFKARVDRALDEQCWFCGGGTKAARCGACGRGW